MATRKPTHLEMTFLLAFHATVSGGFLVAYLTGDDDLYRMHQFAGYTVLIALLIRLAVAILAPSASPLRLPRPDPHGTLAYLRRLAFLDPKAMRERSPLHAWMAVLLLLVVGLAALTGAVADFILRAENLHEAMGEAAPLVVIAHIALVLGLHGMKRLSLLTDAAPAASR